MTKEELEKESQQYALLHATPSLYRVVAQVYLAGAEPREKRIAELEKENAELKRNKKIIAHLGNVIEQIQNEKIAKAKELLNEFMRISDEDFEHAYSELIGEAEQFLNSEVEK